MAIGINSQNPNDDPSSVVNTILEQPDAQDKEYQEYQARIDREVAHNQRMDQIGLITFYVILGVLTLTIITLIAKRIRLRKNANQSSARFDHKRRILNRALLILGTLPVVTATGVVMYYAMAISIDGLWSGGASDRLNNSFSLGILGLITLYVLLLTFVIRKFRSKF